MLVFGAIILGISGYFSLTEYQIITKGETVGGTVSGVITVNGEDGETYKPEIRYTYAGQGQVYTPNYSSRSNKYVAGDPINLLVSEKGVRIKGFNAGLLGIMIGLIVGAFFFVFGLVWFRRHRKHFDEVARLKRFGNRVQARFVKQETTNISINDQHGVILSFQGEGSNRIFKTSPIHSQFSIKWLEEHSFDVYVDPSDHTKYFVDLEKHFGHTQPHN